MSYITKKRIGDKTYFYEVKNIRVGKNKWKKETKYLGKNNPQITFLTDIQIKKLDQIKQFYNKTITNKAKQEYLKNFSTVFTYDTSAIEGSELTLQETRMILRENLTPKHPTNTRDILETKNHEKAFYYMLNYNNQLNLDFILTLHKILKQNVDEDIAGKIRECNLNVLNYKPPHYTELKSALNKFITWYNKNKTKQNPFELAVLTHLYFVCIHPFVDGNGRISRLIANFILNQHNYPLLNIPVKKRQDYYSVLADYDTEKTEKPFVQFLLKLYLKEYKDYL